MAQSIPQPTRLPGGPPTSALPPLPHEKSLPTLLEKSFVNPTRNFSTPVSAKRNVTTSNIPSKLAVRTPSKGIASGLQSPKTPHFNSTPSIPTLRSVSNTPHTYRQPFPSQLPPLPGLKTASTSSSKEPSPVERALKKSISFASFPQPPKGLSRVSTASSRPSLGGSSKSSFESHRRVSGDLSGPANGLVRNKKIRLSNENASKSSLSLGSPSLANGTGEGRSVFTGAEPGNRGSDGLLSIPSPPHSRSSSAQGSYSTSATTFEDIEDAPRRQREATEETSQNGRLRKNSNDGKGNVVVSVRIRPDGAGKKDPTSLAEWVVDGRKSLIGYRGREGGDYLYDHVFTSNDQNDRVYNSSAKRLVRRVMEGYNGTVFAYGMTGTGKTYSMQGTDDSPGVIPMAINDIFAFIRETPRKEFLLRVSYLEIYNEKIHDLLTATAGMPGIGNGDEIKLREDSTRGVYAYPLTEEVVQSPTQLLRVIYRGDLARKTGNTQFNAHSSRSHAVVQIVVESRDRIVNPVGVEDKRAPLVPGGCRVSTLSLIDLAGSERAAEDKDRRTEGAHINKSLLTLGTVIARLSSEDGKSDKEKKHLPYRDSKLTRLLQGALSGNSLISILCTIQIGSSSASNVATHYAQETLNTLKFASRAKNNIVSHAKVTEAVINSGADPRVLLDRYRMEIQNLRSQLEMQSKFPTTPIQAKQSEKEEEVSPEQPILEMQLARTALSERIEHLQKLILSSQSVSIHNDSTRSSITTLARMNTQRSVSSALDIFPSRSSLSRAALNRTHSGASTATIGKQIPAQRSRSPSSEIASNSNESHESASLRRQNRALLSDLAEKDKHIKTLEDRLHQARRVSSQRTSSGFSPVAALQEKSAKLQEKEAEVVDLKLQLQDKERMLVALRTVIRTRRSDSSNSNSITPAARGTNNPLPPLPLQTHQRQHSRSFSYTHQQSQSQSRSSPTRRPALPSSSSYNALSAIPTAAPGAPPSTTPALARPVQHDRKLSWDQLKHVTNESDGECSEKSDAFSEVEMEPIRLITSTSTSSGSPVARFHRKRSETGSTNSNLKNETGPGRRVDEVSRILDEMIGERVKEAGRVGGEVRA
ncbi:hypothetical protein MMC25_007751 [Agyrium rufum]|nr:hypothetical protein [Agyrium rufum]